MNRCLSIQVNKQVKKWMFEYMNGWHDEQIDGWVDEMLGR